MVVRKYKISDAEMCQQSRVTRQLFIENKPDFVALDTDFDGTFDADWLDDIVAAEGVQTAETRDDVLTQETEDVTAAMKTARTAIKGVRYFADKAFAAQPKIMNELGFNNYDEAANNQANMAIFLLNLYTLANGKHQAALLAVNCPQAKIDAVNTALQGLTTENTEQDAFAKTSPVDTEARINVLNTAYEYWQKANAASKVIYEDNLTMLNLFLLPHGSESPDVVSITGTARDAANNPLNQVQVSILALNVSVMSNSNGNFDMVNLPAGTYTISFSKTGYQTVSQQVTVSPAGIAVADAVLQAV